MRNLLLIRGTLPAADRGFIHYHDGDEIIRVLRGQITVVVGDERRICLQGDVAVIPPHTRHGFVVGDGEVLVEVISEQGMRTFIAVGGDGDERQMIELHRADVPFDRNPPPGRPHTSQEELDDLVRRSTDRL